MMKVAILAILCLCITASKYQLNIYEPADCIYCKFAAEQIKSLIQQYHWYNKLKLVVIDCQKRKHACRDSLNKPLLTMLDENKLKLGEIGGVHSKLYFRDWISQFVDKNPLLLQQIPSTDKYKRIAIKNRQEVIEFFINQTERLAKIKDDRLDILKTAFQMNQNSTSTQSVSNSNSDNGNFQDDFRRIAMIGLPILFSVTMVALVRSRNSGRPRRRQYSMPIVPDEQD